MEKKPMFCLWEPRRAVAIAERIWQVQGEWFLRVKLVHISQAQNRPLPVPVAHLSPGLVAWALTAGGG